MAGETQTVQKQNAKTLYDKLWDDHLVTQRDDGSFLLYIDRHLLRDMLKMQKCDLLDVLDYIAYDSTPIEREKRVELVKKQYVDALNDELRAFDNLILQYYAENGFKELGADKLKTFISIKYNSISDAKEKLQMTPDGIRNHYFELQQKLYCA